MSIDYATLLVKVNSKRQFSTVHIIRSSAQLFISIMVTSGADIVAKSWHFLDSTAGWVWQLISQQGQQRMPFDMTQIGQRTPIRTIISSEYQNTFMFLPLRENIERIKIFRKGQCFAVKVAFVNTLTKLLSYKVEQFGRSVCNINRML